MDNYNEAGGNPITVLACGAIAAGALAVGFLGGLVTGNGAATKKNNKALKEANMKMYKIAKGDKASDVFSEKELNDLEDVIKNNRAKATSN